MKLLRPTATALVAFTVLALTACVPSEATPSPTATSGSATPTASATPTPSPTAAGPEAAKVVVTASGIAVFGTDGSTLVSATYRSNPSDVVAQLSTALGETPTVVPHPAAGESCPAVTVSQFGSLELGTPGGIGSAGFVGSGDLYSALVLGTATASGVPIETVAGVQVGTTRTAFESAIGDEMLLEHYAGDGAYGFDILNPEAGPYDRLGAQAYFTGTTLSSWFAPAAIGFIGDCG